MRTFLLLAAAAGAALAGPASAATRNFGVTGFTKVRVDGPFIVRLATGVAPFARATGGTAAIDRVAIDVQGDTLVVHRDINANSDFSGQDSEPVEVSLGTHEVSAAWLNGSGTLAIDKVKALIFNLSVQGSGVGTIGAAAVDQLNVSASGTGSARLAGTAGRLTAIARGISSIDASALTVKDATLGIDGSGTMAATVTNSVKVDAKGPATVRLTGKPACTLKTNGAATVSGCR
jgi:hypothetical protein